MGLGISLEAEGRPAEAREAFQRARATGALSVELDRFVEQKLRANASN
jgi:MSHA biogenesis protein MshN